MSFSLLRRHHRAAGAPLDPGWSRRVLLLEIVRGAWAATYGFDVRAAGDAPFQRWASTLLGVPGGR